MLRQVEGRTDRCGQRPVVVVDGSPCDSACWLTGRRRKAGSGVVKSAQVVYCALGVSCIRCHPAAGGIVLQPKNYAGVESIGVGSGEVQRVSAAVGGLHKCCINSRLVMGGVNVSRLFTCEQPATCDSAETDVKEPAALLFPCRMPWWMHAGSLCLDFQAFHKQRGGTGTGRAHPGGIDWRWGVVVSNLARTRAKPKMAREIGGTFDEPSMNHAFDALYGTVQD